MVGEKTHNKLISLGVRKIHTLQEMSIDLMERAFGQNGISIWRKANGIDHSPVIQYSERKSISTERTFDKDTIDEGHHLVDSVGKLVTAVFDMDRGIAMGQKAPVDIGLAWQGSGPPLLIRRVWNRPEL